MLSINNIPARGYCRLGDNTLSASVAFLVGGAYYTSAPTVTFTGGGGTGAAGTAIIENGVVVGVTVTNAGTGYTSAPTIGFTGGGGSGAAATAVLDATTVSEINVTNSGGKNITFTDNTIYDADDSRKAVNISLYDHFGGQIEDQITAADGDDAITMVLTGLNPVDGINGIVTVVSANGKVKDGSIYDMVTIKQTGNFVIEY